MFKTQQICAFALAFLLLFSYNFVSAQYSISGKIIDSASSQPIEFAAVSVKGEIHSGTYTNMDGFFKLTDIPAGTYTLEAIYMGYKAAKKKIVINKNITDIQFTLSKSAFFIKPVEVLATRAKKNAPFTKTNISKAEIDKVNLGQDLPYLLKQQPAVLITSDAGAGVGYTNIWIRGSDISRINVTINGIPVNDAESGTAFFVDIPDIASSINSIQVQRGVGTSTNGPGAFGASINISTNNFHTTPYAEISSTYGSFNTLKETFKSGTGILNDHFTLDTRLSYVKSDGYIDRASSNLKSYYLSAAYLNKKTAVRLNIFSGKEKTYQAWNGVPEDSIKAGNRTYNGLGLMSNGQYYNNQTDNYTQTYYQLLWNQEINNKWNFNIAAYLTRGEGHFEEYHIEEPFSNYGLSNPIIGNDTIRTTDLIRDEWLNNYYYGSIFSINYKSKKFSSTLGGGWSRYDGQHYGNVIWAKYPIENNYQYYFNEAYKTDFNTYWKANYQLSKQLTAFLDLQYRNVLYALGGFKDNPTIQPTLNYDFFNPKAGLSFNINAKNNFYLSYAIAHKEPNRTDYRANAENLPKPEELRDLELGYNLSIRSFNLHANLYYMDYTNQLVLTGEINDVGAYTRINTPHSYRAGIELSAALQFAKIFTLSANAALSRNRIRNFNAYIDDYDSGKQKKVALGETAISFSPQVITGGILKAELFKDFDIGISGKYVGKMYLDNTENENRSINSYFINGLQAHYKLSLKGIKAIQFNLMINNIFNVEYITNGYTYAYIEGGKITNSNSYFPQAGINFLFGIDFKF